MRWRGEKVPLVCWRTTIGGWRSELASDGQEYYRYKESDVGPAGVAAHRGRAGVAASGYLHPSGRW